MTESIPVACQPFALSAAERAHARELRATLSAAVQQTRALSDGYAWRYPPDPVLFRTAAEWIGLDRRCCPFLTFSLTWEAGDAAPWLEVTGPEGTLEFLEAEMPELPRE
jgi:hypothetical protein